MLSCYSFRLLPKLACRTASKRSAPLVLQRFASSSGAAKEEVPPEDYHDGHLMADHLEYLDDMIEKTVKMEASIDELKETYAKKKQAYSTIKGTDTEEIDHLFLTAAQQKSELSEHLAELRVLMEQAKKTFAVDAPDGDSDGHVREEMLEIGRLIDSAAEHEDTEAIEYEHREAQEAKKKIFAVDAPDGDSDGHVREEMEEIKHIVDDAAKMEDADEINYRHKMEEEVKKDRARDPEHDW